MSTNNSLAHCLGKCKWFELGTGEILKKRCRRRHFYAILKGTWRKRGIFR